MKKTYILDTNVLLSDGASLFGFEEHNIVLPLIVLEELDRHKDRQDEVGRNAREVVRKLADLTKVNKDFKAGIPLGNKLGTLRILSIEDLDVEGKRYRLPPEMEEKKSGDNTIAQFCVNYMAAHKNDTVVLVTRDTILRLKAQAIGVVCEDYRKFNVAVNASSLYSGVTTIEREDVVVQDFYKEEPFYLPEDIQDALYPNQFVVMKCGQQSAVGKFTGKGEPLRKIQKPTGKLAPRNKEQEFARDLLFDPDIKLVTLSGKAGTGKTINCIDAGIEQILTMKRYRSLVICRPVMPVGKDIGFLPGSLSEKLDPWLAPIKDNLRFLLDAQNSPSAVAPPTSGRRTKAAAMEEKAGRNKFDEQILQSYFDEGIIEVQALTFIRGRSISNAFIIIDECFPGNQTVMVEGDRQVSFSALYNLYSAGKELPKAKSYNESTKSFEWRQILNVKNNGVKNVMHVRLGNREVDVTKNHRFMTKTGWKEAQNLSVGDLILATEAHKHQMLYDLNDEQEQIMIGSYLGDGNVSAHGPSRYRLRAIHGAAQTEYALWKASLVQGGTSSVKFIAKNGYAQKPAVSFCTKMYGSQLPFSVKKTKCDDALIAKIDARALAIWFMDDGSTVQGKFNAAKLWTCSFDHESNLKLCKMLEERFQIQCRAQDVNASHAYRHIVLTASGYRRLCEVIAPWVHGSMAYKIHPDYHNLIGSGTGWQGVDGWITDHNLIAIDEVVLSSTSAVEVFDMEVEGNHNYVVSGKSRVPTGKASGFVVHNCQNTSLHEIKTILTRVGENTKIVLCGDVEQIDNTYVDSVSNGLSIVIERFKDQKIAGHVHLAKGERSLLATLASTVLA